MHRREPEGGVCCQVLDFSASDEEVERSSTGSLSRGAVPKEAPGVISERNIYPCPSLPPLPHPSIPHPSRSFSLGRPASHSIRRRYQRVPGRKTRIIESIVSHPPPSDSSADYKIIITRPPPPPISFSLSPPPPAPLPSRCRCFSRSTLNARLSH